MAATSGVRRAASLLLLLVALLAVAPTSPGQTSAGCRTACRTAVEGCIAWRSSALRDLEVSPRALRRKARAIRRGCERTAVRRCRAEGIGACNVPVICACGR